MSGTISGGRKARDANLKNNPNFYKEIGKIGGQKGRTGGFYVNRELARTAGAKGGRKSKRVGKLVTVTGGNDPNIDGGLKVEPDNDLWPETPEQAIPFTKEEEAFAKKKHWWSK